MKNKDEKKMQKTRQAKSQKMTRRADSEKQRAPLDKPVEVNDVTFKEIVENHPLVVVDCWAPWGRPCNAIAPIIEGLSKDYAGKVLFGILNVDENPQVTMKYGILSTPTLLIFKSGKLRDKIIGAMPRQTLEPKITQYL